MGNLDDIAFIKKELEQIRSAIFGSAEKPEGINIKLDRLLQSEAKRVWALNAVVVAIMGILAKIIFEGISWHK